MLARAGLTTSLARLPGVVAGRAGRLPLTFCNGHVPPECLPSLFERLRNLPHLRQLSFVDCGALTAAAATPMPGVDFATATAYREFADSLQTWLDLCTVRV